MYIPIEYTHIYTSKMLSIYIYLYPIEIFLQVFDISPMSLLKQRLMGSAMVAVEVEEAGAPGIPGNSPVSLR